MEKSNRRKIFYIIVSVFIASIVWFYVNYSQEVTLTVNDVPVELLNEETTLAERGLMVLGGGDIAVDLKLRVPRSIVFRFDTDKIRAVADLSAITAAGKQSLGYQIYYPTGISAHDVTVELPAVRSVQVEIGELSRKDVEIRCKVVGSVSEGYIAGTLRLLPETLEVRGQQVDIMSVSYALVTLNITDATASIVELLDYELYDFNDQPVHNPNIHPVSEQIQVTMPVMTVKEVPLVVNFEESSGARLDHFTYTLEPQTITVSGDAATVESIGEIVLDTVVLDTLSEQENFVYDIVLPDGISNLSGVNTATLTITQGDIGMLTLDATQFDYENLSAKREVSIVTSTLSVTLRGTQEDLAAVTPEQVRVVADLSDVADASGSYTVPANVYVDALDLGAVGEYEVTVHIGDKQ